ncbi:hypothetical protein L1987_35660 [Smallanthus sonchifolius]|uniref:Uncharacterized protein n=1 Tax=Smallanthus sonchifolius TaxID=185202 RepID=A0ACB9HC78_9ASTR|nr:hypothetical protein L1987_35660 [Smallanthus sonchifolius]
MINSEDQHVAVIVRLEFLSPPRSRLEGWIYQWSSQVWNMCYRVHRPPILPVLSIQQNCMGPISHTAIPLDMCYLQISVKFCLLSF